MSHWNTKLLHLVLAVTLFATGMVRSAPQNGDQEQMLHNHFDAIVSATSEKALADAERKLSDFVGRNNVSDQVVAGALLSYMTASRNPKSIVVISEDKATIENPTALARVWAAGLESDNEATRAVSQSLLSSIDRRENGQADFAIYRQLLADKAGNLPVSLVRYMYDTDRSAAVLALGRSTMDVRSREYRELLYSQHMIEHAVWLITHNFDEGLPEASASAKAQLAQLAKSDAWWARVYAARTVVRYRRLADESVTEALLNDPHDEVRDAIQPLRKQ